jgi:hypothetical protein
LIQFFSVSGFDDGSLYRPDFYAQENPMTALFSRSRLWHLVLLLLASTYLTALAEPEPTGTSKNLRIQLSMDRRGAKVSVPATVKRVTVQRSTSKSGWQTVANTVATPGTMRFSLPSNPRGTKWRALGWSNANLVNREKFPSLFYQGTHQFSPVESSTAWPMDGMIRPVPMVSHTATIGNTALGDKEISLSAGQLVEADIWKVEGNQVYFFNQLRGLQILDLSNPADPRLTASLRLPAVGQDLYLLPGTGGTRHLVLLTEGWSNGSGQWTCINLVKVADGKIEITHRQEINGNLSDSRMIGNRLVLATNEWNYTSTDWNSRSRLTEWLITPDAAPVAAGETLIEGSSPLIAAGPDWLALAVQPKNEWNSSEVSIFALRPTGLVRLREPIRTEGRVETKFGMSWNDNVLTTISESSWRDGQWSPVTVLENFRAWAPEVIHPAVVEASPLARLELARGEGLFATRFAGSKAYIVTFLRTDPLWVVDLSDALNPSVSGHLEVPGWSTYLQPIGDLLFSIGLESGTVAASLFDVADPAAPTLLRRLNLGEAGSYSEANWDEKALRVMPEAGLAMVPISHYRWANGDTNSFVQLIDIDLNARDLRLRGKIDQAFDARRSDLVGDSVVSISQRILTTADIADRDAPEILAEVSLAWPVDRAVAAGEHLLQIEDSGTPTVRISPATAPESILAEFPLGTGTVRAADLRDGKLYVLRETSPTGWGYFLRPITTTGSGENALTLDIYDASSLPTLTLIGTCSTPLEWGASVASNGLLWPQANRPVALINYQSSYFYNWGPIMVDDGLFLIAPAISAPIAGDALTVSMSRPMIAPYYESVRKSPRLATFDITVASGPVAGPLLAIGADGLTASGVVQAGDGLLVLGVDQFQSETTSKGAYVTKNSQLACVVEVSGSQAPVIRPFIDLPGQLFAISDLDANGFLAFTRKTGAGNTTDFQVSASDGFDAFVVAGLNETGAPAATAAGRRLFVSRPTGAQIYQLSNEGKWVTQSLINLPWQPSSLRWVDSTLVGGQGNSLFAATADGGSVKTWTFPAWNPGLEKASLDASGALLVPFGQYGVERLER